MKLYAGHGELLPKLERSENNGLSVNVKYH